MQHANETSANNDPVLHCGRPAHIGTVFTPHMSAVSSDRHVHSINRSFHMKDSRQREKQRERERIERERKKNEV